MKWMVTGEGGTYAAITPSLQERRGKDLADPDLDLDLGFENGLIPAE